MPKQSFLSRRDFLKLSATSLTATTLMQLPGFASMLEAAVAEVPVIWIQTGSCTGCVVSVINSASPSIQAILLDQVIPGKHISLKYNQTVMAASGDLAMKAMEKAAEKKGGFVLIAEGAFSTKDDGLYCQIGEREGKGITGLEHLVHLGSNAMAVIALGTCACFAGIPAAPPNPTGCKSVNQVFAEKGIKTPVINVAGCPPHPDWFVGTVATILIGGLAAVKVDNNGRPLAFYGSLMHDNCERRGHFDAGRFAKKFSDPYCLYELGCKGPITHADCPSRRWNNGTNWCIGCGHPCIGCVEPEFPFEKSLYDIVPLDRVTPPATYPGIEAQQGTAPKAARG